MTSTFPIDDFLKFKHLPDHQSMTEDLMKYLNSKSKKKPDGNWLLTKKLEQTGDEKMCSQFRSILNKLSESNFQVLLTEISEINMEKPEILEQFTEMLFNKAIIEKKFSSMYSRLAKQLINLQVTHDGITVHFRESLINRCQVMFNQLINFGEGYNHKLAVGCMAFIGDLYNFDMLVKKIICSCFSVLLNKLDKVEGELQYIIECICVLMRTVGKKLVVDGAADAASIFEHLKTKLSDSKLSNREKFAIMDLMDLKTANKW